MARPNLESELWLADAAVGVMGLESGDDGFAQPGRIELERDDIGLGEIKDGAAHLDWALDCMDVIAQDCCVVSTDDRASCTRVLRRDVQVLRRQGQSGIDMDDGMTAADAPLVPADDPRSLRRREDQRFLVGAGHYLDDRPVAGELFAAIVRSPHAHAAILSIDTAAAVEMPGVHGVFTADDLADLHPLPCYIVVKTVDPLIVPPRYPLARDRVRHVGDPVAFVVAGTREQARDACEQVIVDYDILPSVTELAAR
jgi:hypothetical protein